ncbi:MAG: DUF4040 domain-containing protein [Acidimicrobiales bacterium]|nr:DUF4040 domain-containing protein [Acidimicrobiales bacterium]
MTAGWVLAAFFVAAPSTAWLGGRFGPRAAFSAAAVPMTVALLWALRAAPEVLGGDPHRMSWDWVPAIGLQVDLLLDGFALLFVLLITGIGALICLYAAWYFDPDEHVGLLAGLLVAFAGAMVGVVLSDNLLLVYVFWEITSITSYLLIGTKDRLAASRDAALQALLVTGAGGLAMLGGFVLLAQQAGSTSLSGLLADPPSGLAAEVGLGLVLVGALSKSAQVPLHFWLPGAMAAPTPISAYLHSATMVKAGVYLIARFAPPFAEQVAWWRPVVIGFGLTTMVVGGWRALRQHDAKLLLAFGTVSQLGLMVALLGAGVPALTFAGIAVLLAHALYKAALFMVVGVVDHQAHTRDLRALGMVVRRWPFVAAVSVVAALSMAGLGPLFGFVAKEAAFEALLHGRLSPAVTAGVLIGSLLSVAFSARLVWGFWGRLDPAAPPLHPRHGSLADPEHDPAHDDADDTLHRSTPVPFIAPAALLATLSLLAGLWPGLVLPLVEESALALDPRADGGLYLWHGFTGALLLSVIAIVGGAVLLGFRVGVERLQRTLSVWPSAVGAYRSVLRWTLLVAGRVTAVAQNGSLPTYLTVVLTTALVVPAVALAGAVTWPDAAVGFESPLQLVVVVITAAIALGVTVARRRFAAIVCLGGVGFSVALLFVLHGAPDLALTQLLLETLTLIVFVLVLRRLPDRFTLTSWPAARSARLLLAVGVGVFITAFALTAAAQRTEPPVSDGHVARALSEGGGANVVNVILVDFRGFDTLGEITVLATAAVGIAGLVQAGRRRGTP